MSGEKICLPGWKNATSNCTEGEKNIQVDFHDKINGGLQKLYQNRENE